MYSIFTNIYLKKDNALRMLHRSADKAIWPDALLGIGGKVEPNEDLFDAAKREFKEEAGVDLLDLQLVGTLTWLDDSNNNGINYIFVASGYEGQLLETCDEGVFEWVDIKELLVSKKTAVHQLKYLPYLMNGQHFSQYLVFKGDFSDGVIIEDHNSVGYSNNRLSKNVGGLKIDTTNDEKLNLLQVLVDPYNVQVVRSNSGCSVDVEIFSEDKQLNAVLKNGIKKTVEDDNIEFNPQNALQYYADRITDSTNIVLEYTISLDNNSKTVYVPARLTNVPKFTAEIEDNFFWSFVQFDINNNWTYYVDLKAENKQSVFSLLAQAILNV